MSNSNDAKDPVMSPSSILTFSKDLLSLLRDLLLFIIALLLIFSPQSVNKTLVKAGFKKANVAGFEWEAQFSETDDKLKEAQQTITALTNQLDSSEKILAQVQGKLNDDTLKRKLDNLEKVNKELDSASKQVQASVRKTISSNADLVQKVQESVTVSDQWGVVYSADVNIKTAQYEINDLARLKKIPNATLYKRQGMYRSVSVLNDFEEAQKVLRSIKLVRKDAYVVRMSKWCANSAQKTGYLECEE